MFIALKPMRIGKEDRAPGYAVPEADDWDPGIQQSLVHQGIMRDVSDMEAERIMAEAIERDRLSKLHIKTKKLAQVHALLVRSEERVAKARQAYEAAKEDAAGIRDKIARFEQDILDLGGKLEQGEPEPEPEEPQDGQSSLDATSDEIAALLDDEPDVEGELQELTVTELRDRAQELGIRPLPRNKNDIIEAILSAIAKDGSDDLDV